MTTDLLALAPGLEARLTRFYRAFARRFSYVGLRLFLRAGLDSQDLADSYTFPLNERVLSPVIEALRREAKLPPLRRKAILRAERELVMTLHASVVHLGIRKYIYGSPLPDDLDEHVAFCVNAFMAGALHTLRSIHKKPRIGFLAERLNRGGDGPIE